MYRMYVFIKSVDVQRLLGFTHRHLEILAWRILKLENIFLLSNNGFYFYCSQMESYYMVMVDGSVYNRNM